MNLSRRSRWILFAAGLLILCPHLRAQGLSEAAHHAKTSSPDLAIVHLEKDIPDLMSQADVPGLSIAILRNGRTAWLHNFGIKDTKNKQPVTDDTIFEAASLSKPCSPTLSSNSSIRANSASTCLCPPISQSPTSKAMIA